VYFYNYKILTTIITNN